MIAGGKGGHYEGSTGVAGQQQGNRCDRSAAQRGGVEVCWLNEGAITYNGRSLEIAQLLQVQLLSNPGRVGRVTAGTRAGLQYPLTIVSVGSTWEGLGRENLDLRRDDKVIELA